MGKKETRKELKVKKKSRMKTAKQGGPGKTSGPFRHKVFRKNRTPSNRVAKGERKWFATKKRGALGRKKNSFRAPWGAYERNRAQVG